MKKIPTIFKRNPDNMSLVLNEWNEKCIWVKGGHGAPLRKYDGECYYLGITGMLFKRYTLRPGKKAPDSFCEVDYDPNTGKRFGWVEVDIYSSENKYAREGISNIQTVEGIVQLGCTHELCGPKIQGNAEKLDKHTMFCHHLAEKYTIEDRTFEGIRSFLKDKDIEGIVFYHADGFKAKIKKKDFGLKR